MDITLYRDCPITDDYKLLFNTGYYSSNLTNTAFNLMLNNLTQTTLTIGDVYLNDSGKFYLDLVEDNTTTLLSLYNYMSFEIQTSAVSVSNFNLTTDINYPHVGSKSFNGLKRYAFIKNITYYTDTIEVEYECDYYHTYAILTDNFTGLLTRYSYDTIRLLNNNYPNIKLNTPYFSNKELLKYNISGSTIASGLSGNQDCYCFATIQYYTLGQSGERTSRRLDSVMISHGTSSSSISQNNFKYTIDEWNLYISRLLVNQSTTNTINNEYYEIQDIFFIPTNMNVLNYPNEVLPINPPDSYKIEDWITKLLDTTNTPLLYIYSLSNFIEYTDNNNTYYFYLMSLGKYFDDNSWPTYKTTMNHSFMLSKGKFANNLKRKGIGFYTHMIPVTSDNPNIDIEYKITMAFDCANIRFYLEVENQVIEITEDIKVEYPISVQTADATQLQAVSRAINNVKIKNQSQTQAYNKLFDASTVFGIGTLFNPGRVLQSVGNVMESYNTLGQAEQDLKLLNAEVYTSNTSVDADSLAFINAYYGLIDFRLDTTNDSVVNANTKKQGYIVSTNLLCNKENAIFGLASENYHGQMGTAINQVPYMRYSNVYITGKYPQNVRNILKQIFENGFRFVNSYNATDYETYL